MVQSDGDGGAVIVGKVIKNSKIALSDLILSQ